LVQLPRRTSPAARRRWRRRTPVFCRSGAWIDKLGPRRAGPFTGDLYVALGLAEILLPLGLEHPGPGVDLAADGREGSKALIAGLRRHRHFEPEADPPRL
jgi:hypothetical protein